MVITDSNVNLSPCPYQTDATYEITGGGVKESDFITSFEKTQEIKTTSYSLKDYNFECPNNDLTVKNTSDNAMSESTLEIYNYPGRYIDIDNGDRLVNIRVESCDAEVTTVEGDSQCKAFNAGFLFELMGHPRDDMNMAYLLVEISHHPFYEPYPKISIDKDISGTYRNTFKCIPADIPFRPRLKTPRPFIQGCQTAIVVGQKNEEIETDEHGRIHVQFHWDRDGAYDEKSSCWIRVGQTWAGASWGAVVIPRVGQEVIVNFLEGNPDRPIVTGCVYHGENRPPYKLADEKTKTTFRSDSYKGDGGFNEIRFEDLKDKEEIFIHAQKDMLTIVENEKISEIGNNRINTIKNNRKQTILKVKIYLLLIKKGGLLKLKKVNIY